MLRLIDLVKVLIAGLDDWYTGMKMRRRLQQQVGRKVEDRELVSIRAWMSDENSGGKK
jgi:hypothetical protein